MCPSTLRMMITIAQTQSLPLTFFFTRTKSFPFKCFFFLNRIDFENISLLRVCTMFKRNIKKKLYETVYQTYENIEKKRKICLLMFYSHMYLCTLFFSFDTTHLKVLAIVNYKVFFIVVHLYLHLFSFCVLYLSHITRCCYHTDTRWKTHCSYKFSTIPYIH